MLQLPSPRTQLFKKGSGAAGAAAGSAVHQHGDGAWQQLLKAQQQQDKEGRQRTRGGQVGALVATAK